MTDAESGTIKRFLMTMVALFLNFMPAILSDNGNKGCHLYGYHFASEDLDDYMMQINVRIYGLF